MAIETAGTYSEETKNILRNTGRRLTKAPGDHRENFWSLQKLSLTVQSGNAAITLSAEREIQRYFGSQKSFKIGLRF